MEGSIYSNLGTKINRTFKEKRDSELTLSDHLQNKIVISTREELDKIFLSELKRVLAKENLKDLIESFFELENNLSLVLDSVEFEFIEFNFDEFYKNLSPLLLRSLLEHTRASQENDQLIYSLKESLRIALEDEYYTHESRF